MPTIPLSALIPKGSRNLIVAGRCVSSDRLANSGLRDRDIAVLTLHRGTTVIPNPMGSRELEAGDRLLCFGKLEEMRSMIPERRRRRARVKKLPKNPIPDA